MANSPIILAVDTSDFDTARAWIDATRESIDIYKLGLEFFLTFGAEGIESIARESGASIFLDLKLHDIPNTVRKSAGVVDHLHPRFLTVHASGGGAMISAAPFLARSNRMPKAWTVFPNPMSSASTPPIPQCASLASHP